MFRSLLIGAVAFSMVAGTATVAAPCRDAKGKFAKCAPKAVPNRCVDAKSKKFAKCGAPGAIPAMSKK